MELLTYLGGKQDYRLVLVTKRTEILFDNFAKLNIEWVQMEGEKIGFSTFLEFFKIASRVKPDLIHTWGNIQTFIALCYKILNRSVKLINSQITSAPPVLSREEAVISRLNFRFSDLILSNSHAGILAYNPPRKKSRVIYNGLNFDRFQNLPAIDPIRAELGLITKYVIIMVGTYSPNKDYLRFFKIGIEVSKLRNDVSFIGIGFFKGGERIYESCLKMTADFPNLLPMKGSKNIEPIVNACDLGVLLSPNGEGLSNAILEYMALGKPVIANDAGGTREIVRHGENGLLVDTESDLEIAMMIDQLLNNPEKIEEMGARSKERILADFSLERMGKEFETVYHEVLAGLS